MRCQDLMITYILKLSTVEEMLFAEKKAHYHKNDHTVKNYFVCDSLICSFNKYSLSTYYVSGTDLGSVKRQGPCTHGIYLPVPYCYSFMTFPALLNSGIHMGRCLVGVCAFSLLAAGVWTRR